MKIHKDTKIEELRKLIPDSDSCGTWCEFGSGFLADEDLDAIAQHLDMPHEAVDKVYLEEKTLFNTTRKRPKLLKEDESLPHGRCVFMKGEKCSLGHAKPLHCKISKHGDHAEDVNEWFMLNHFVNTKDTRSLQEWHMRVKQKGMTIPGGRLHELVPDMDKENNIRDLFNTEYEEENEASEMRKHLSPETTKKEKK